MTITGQGRNGHNIKGQYGNGVEARASAQDLFAALESQGLLSDAGQAEELARGLGIIDIKGIFGVGCVRNTKRIGLVVELEFWDKESTYDRTGLTEETVDILGIPISYLRIPVRPGRNLAIIIEVAALNHRLKELGVNPAERFNERVLNIIQERSN